MKNIGEVMQKYTAGEIELEEANEKLKEFGKWPVQGGLSEQSLKQVIKASCERCLP